MDLDEPMTTAAPLRNVHEFTVSELAASLKRTIEDGYAHVRVRGEISGFRGAHGSGHCYFSLKDDRACIEAVVWRGSAARLQRHLVEGLEVIATGRLSTFPGRSKYQIVVEALEPAGVGALMAMFEERRRRLTLEGLFEEGRKRPLPFMPRVIGVVTSPTGAVIRDILHRLNDRFPAHVMVWPVRVQGETSAAEVAGAITGFNAFGADPGLPRPDLLIVARGGGSLEDLWGFNEEIVVRAVAASAIPLISAVGHETDWTLIDMVADHRAPTPTAAAERAVPVRRDLIEGLLARGLRLGSAASRNLERGRTELRSAERGLGRAEDLVAGPRQRLDELAARAPRALLSLARGERTHYARVAGRLTWRGLSARVARAEERLEGVERRRAASLGNALAVKRRRLDAASGRLRPDLVRERAKHQAGRLEALGARATRAIVVSLRERAARTIGLAKLFDTLNYTSVLARGFALVRDEGGAPLRSVGEVSPGARLEVQLADGSFAATAGAGASPPRRRARRTLLAPASLAQTSLFGDLDA